MPRENFDIELWKVGFSYEKDREILKDLCLTIPQGSFVSLVGESGCGKSTIAGLLTGKLGNYQGEILIGGKLLSRISEKELMEHVTLVRHNSYIFKGTVEENLRMAKPQASEEEMKKVLSRVNLLGFSGHPGRAEDQASGTGSQSFRRTASETGSGQSPSP